MKHSMRMLSVLTACVISAAVFPASALAAANAEDISVTEVSDIYNTTVSAESKAETGETVSEEPFNVFDIYKAHQEYQESLNPEEPEEPEEPQEPAKVPSIYRSAKGIDVSYAQGQIDWAAVKESGVEFAIIRAGYGNANAYPNQVDTWFRYNMEEASKVGMDVGVYWYSYAKTVEGATNEAESCYNLIKGYDLKYPVFFDFEEPYTDSTKTTQLSAYDISRIVDTFCSNIESKGYFAGIYSYSNLLATKVYDNVREKYTVWVASVGISEDTLRNQFPYDFGIWQYSWTGRVNGINGDVDLDQCYINYPYLISPETYTGPYEDGSYTETPPAKVTPTNTGVAKGIDVSEWQGDIDWKSVAASGIDFAIVRAGYGMYESQKDAYFEKNMEGAKAAGIGCGAYWYSYATNVTEAQKEAELFYETIKGYKFEYPIYFDIESVGVAGLNAAQISKITDTFCSYMESKGYYIGVRSYTSFLNSKFEPEIFEKYDVWVSQFDVAKPQYTGTYGLWQYSSTGTVNGISTPVDMDYAYYNFPNIMTYNHLNGC